MTAGIKANSDGSGAIQVGGTDVIGLGTTGNDEFLTDCGAEGQKYVDMAGW
jgi:hypothetical protein